MGTPLSDRQRAYFDLSRRALEGASPEELTAETLRLLADRVGEDEARATAEALSSLARDPDAEISVPSDPFAREILELVRSGLAARAQQAAMLRRYQTLLDSSSDGICVIDRDGYYVDMNARGCEMLGYTLEELRRLRIFDLVLPDEPPVDLAGLRKGPIVRTRHIRCKDGSLLLAEIGARLLPDGGIVGIFRDVRERVRAERELADRAERFRQALDAARAGAWELDVTTGQRFWSAETYALLGLEPRSGRDGSETLMDRVHPDDREELDRAMERCAREGGDLDLELRIVMPDGRARWFRDVAKSVKDAHGRVVRMYGVLIDIDDAKRSELARAAAEASLQQAQRMEAIGRLAGGVAHDFNNLLTVMLTATDMINAVIADDHPAAEHVDAIREAASRGAEVTRQLLALSRHAPVEREIIDVNARIRGLAHILRRLLREDIHVRMDLASALPVVRMDRGQLDQIVINLACNARDAMPRGGTLTFTTGVEALDGKPHVVLSVADTGDGMDDATRARVFEPFFTTKPPDRGTGLGLATVYGIIAQNQGRIEVESELGRGTRFVAWLPAATAEEIAQEKAARPLCSRPVLGTRVLVVEDERAVRRLVRRALEANGHRVLEAADGDEALYLARTAAEPIELLVTDVVMPKLSGPELAERLRADLPGLRVLFMSGHPGDALACGLGEGLAWIEKPFTPDELRAAVESVMRSAHSPRSASTSSS